MHNDQKKAMENRTEASASPARQEGPREGADQRDAGASDLAELRQQRIQDYLRATLSSPVAQVAVLGSISADLAMLELQLCQTIQQAAAACKTEHDYLDTVPEDIETLLKVSRQLERNLRLAHELADEQAWS